jgi:hypothetical protein
MTHDADHSIRTRRSLLGAAAGGIAAAVAGVISRA